MPKPPTPPAPTTDTNLVFGYGNMFLPYILKQADKNRIDAQLALITTMGVSLFVALELHEENGATDDGKLGALEYLRSRLPVVKPGWKVAEGKGGNHLLYDATKYVVLFSAHKLLGSTDKRWATKWNLRRTTTGQDFWVVGYHAPAGTTAARKKARTDQMAQLIAWTTDLERVVYALDKNSLTTGDSSKQLNAAGRRSVWSTNVKNAHLDSHIDGNENAQHIDDVQIGSHVRFRPGAELVDTGNLADHRWLKVPLTITA